MGDDRVEIGVPAREEAAPGRHSRATSDWFSTRLWRYLGRLGLSMASTGVVFAVGCVLFPRIRDGVRDVSWELVVLGALISVVGLALALLSRAAAGRRGRSKPR